MMKKVVLIMAMGVFAQISHADELELSGDAVSAENGCALPSNSHAAGCGNPQDSEPPFEGRQPVARVSGVNEEILDAKYDASADEFILTLKNNNACNVGGEKLVPVSTVEGIESKVIFQLETSSIQTMMACRGENTIRVDAPKHRDGARILILGANGSRVEYTFEDGKHIRPQVAGN